MAFLPKDVQLALDAARRMAERRSGKLSIHVDDKVFPVARLWDTGFAIRANDAPQLRGFVDLYNGPRHIAQCLIMKTRHGTEEFVYEFKWSNGALEQPPADYIKEPNAPIALLETSG